MKVYKKCENCDSALDQSKYPCWKCGGEGYIETEIPVEQALDALRSARTMLSKAVYPGTREVIEKAIEALEECVK